MPVIASAAAVGLIAELLGWPSTAAVILMITLQIAAALAYAKRDQAG
jgi:membrane protein implicated in regulation of membrane protease activity